MKLKSTLQLALAASLIAGASATLAGDAEAGKVKSATCMPCHGAQGISATDIWPNLAGQKEGYLVKQMKAFRDGTRDEPTMSPMAAGLSDEDIDDLAAYYSALGR